MDRENWTIGKRICLLSFPSLSPSLFSAIPLHPPNCVNVTHPSSVIKVPCIRRTFSLTNCFSWLDSRIDSIGVLPRNLSRFRSNNKTFFLAQLFVHIFHLRQFRAIRKFSFSAHMRCNCVTNTIKSDVYPKFSLTFNVNDYFVQSIASICWLKRVEQRKVSIGHKKYVV